MRAEGAGSQRLLDVLLAREGLNRAALVVADRPAAAAPATASGAPEDQAAVAALIARIDEALNQDGRLL